MIGQSTAQQIAGFNPTQVVVERQAANGFKTTPKPH